MTARGVGWELPREYARTVLSLMLDVCARFGAKPNDGWWERLTRGERALLIAHERVKQAEESRTRAGA